MKALIDSNQICQDGFYIQDVVDTEFDVHPDWFWVDCSDDVTKERNYYKQSDNTFPVRQEVIDHETLVASTNALNENDPDVITPSE